MIDVKQVLEQFKLDKPRKKVFGNYRIKGNLLLWVTTRTEEERFSKDEIKELIAYSKDSTIVGYTLDQAKIEIAKSYSGMRFKFVKEESNEIARKIIVDGKPILLGNSSILPLVGRIVAYGSERLNRSETAIQREMASQGFTMIPFSVFVEAKLNLDKYKLIDRGNECDVVVTVEKDGNHLSDWNPIEVDESRHFTGASLFEVDGQVYLFDIDQNEIKYKIFNPFLATIKGKPKTISEAYAMLKPKEVVQAEKKGLTVLRQGEWFFIKTKAPKVRKLSDKEKLVILGVQRFNDVASIIGVKKDEKKANKLLEGIPKQGNIQAGTSRPNTVQRLLKQGKTTYASGLVKHSGREHKDLNLGKDWYKVVPNTSIKNFTITGDID